jgi:hypothetical protein
VFCVFCPFWSASIIMPGIGSMALHPWPWAPPSVHSV